MSDGWHPVYSVKIALLQGGMHMLLKSVCLPMPALWLKISIFYKDKHVYKCGRKIDET